jgi:transposase
VSVAASVSSSTVVVAVDVGKNCVALSVTDAGRHRLFGPVEFAMTRPALDRVVARIGAVLPADGVVKVGVEAAGHYHLPMITGSAWPAGWEVLELNPAHVGAQRRVAGRRRVKTDAIDLEAITDLVLAGRGIPVTAREEVLSELTAWTAHRSRRVGTRTATKNQLLGSAGPLVPRVDPGVAGCVGHQSRSSRRGGVRRPGPVGRAGREPVHPVRRAPDCGCPGRSPSGW